MHKKIRACKISARSTFVQGSLVLNILYTALRILHLSQKTAHDEPTNIQSVIQWILQFKSLLVLKVNGRSILWDDVHCCHHSWLFIQVALVNFLNPFSKLSLRSWAWNLDCHAGPFWADNRDHLSTRKRSWHHALDSNAKGGLKISLVHYIFLDREGIKQNIKQIHSSDAKGGTGRTKSWESPTL